jgi:hypothetical protein
LAAAVQECVALLRSSFNFRGFTLKDQVGECTVPVSRAALRNVLPATLLALTDRAASPADLVLSVQAGSGPAVLSVALQPTDGTAGFAGEAPYRLIEWNDVAVLADAEGIAFEKDGDTVRLTLPAQRG